MFLSYFDNKLSVNSCEIVSMCCCVSKVCYFQSWVYPTIASLMKGMISSFSFKLLFLSYFGGKLFVSFLWVLMRSCVGANLLCNANCTCQIKITNYLSMCSTLLQVLWHVQIMNSFIFLQNCLLLSCCFLKLWILDAKNKSSIRLNLSKNQNPI